MQDIYSDFGKRFKELRELNKLTQEQLAEFIGVEARQISRIETGKCFTTLDNLKKISELYKIDIKDMFNFSHFKSKEELIQTIVFMLNSATEDNCRKAFKIIKELIY
ncbi:MAG: helix-turn-helix transcriptional regulator [bacterium]|nr:helix-turn-helix transcriptional regulator [bacterium]